MHCAEIGFLTATSEKLFKTVFELQPRESGSGGGATSTREEKVKTITLLIISISIIAIKVKTIVDDISEKMPDQFNMHDIMAKCEERTPYIIVCFQVNKFSSLHNTAMFDGCPLMFEFFLGY